LDNNTYNNINVINSIDAYSIEKDFTISKKINFSLCLEFKHKDEGFNLKHNEADNDLIKKNQKHIFRNPKNE